MSPARRLKVVLDTNVVFSGILTRSGPPFEILHHWHARAFALLLNDSINREYHRVVSEARTSRRLKLRGFDADLFLQLLAIDSVWIELDAAPIIKTRDRSYQVVWVTRTAESRAGKRFEPAGRRSSQQGLSSPATEIRTAWTS